MTSTSDSDSDIEFIDGLRAPKARVFKERVCYLDTLDEMSFLRRFRMSKESFRLLLEKIRRNIEPVTAR